MIFLGHQDFMINELKLWKYLKVIDVMVIDLRTAQVYCDPIFLVSQEVSLNFHHFCG